MRITLKTKIWITVLAIVMMFVFFILFYFPEQQEKYHLKNYNKEVQNLVNTVALGVSIALKEQNFEGVQMAMDFVKEDPHLRFVSLLQVDTVWNKEQTNFTLEKTIFKTYPDSAKVTPALVSNDSMLVKTASFETPMMNGEIMLGVTTDEIIQSKKQIRLTSVIVSTVVFGIGIMIGFWLARNISVPVLALRDAANRVGEGDLTQRVRSRSNDEIGELGLAFNKMVEDLSKAQKEVQEKTKDLTNEKKKSDELLLNILPADTAEELKLTGVAKAKNYESVTVLFADFKDFTTITDNLEPEQVVDELNYCFSAFDRIVQKFGLEKIKTIGDAYMCAGGLPAKNNTHPLDVVNAAIEMRDFMEAYQKEKCANQGLCFEIRLGINSGPVVAGIVGFKKFAYDIWGSTVNIASRMESSSEPGKINVSGNTYTLIKEHFNCIHRGRIKAKSMGEIEMYFVDSIREPATAEV